LRASVILNRDEVRPGENHRRQHAERTESSLSGRSSVSGANRFLRVPLMNLRPMHAPVFSHSFPTLSWRTPPQLPLHFLYFLNQQTPPSFFSLAARSFPLSLARPHPCVIPDKKFGTQKSLPFYIYRKHTPALNTRLWLYVRTNFNKRVKKRLGFSARLIKFNQPFYLVISEFNEEN